MIDDILEILQLGCAVKLDRFQAVRLGTCIKSLEDKNKALEDLAAHRMQSINGLIAEKEALQEVNEQLAHELNMHRPHTDMLADLAAHCVQREIGQAGQNAHEAIMAHCDALAAKLELIKSEWIKGNFSTKCISIAALRKVIETTPQQCVAEIKAEAIEASLDAIGAPATKFLFQSNDFAAGFNHCAALLKTQAAKVRQGEQSGTWLKDSNVNGGKRQGGE